MIQELWTSTWLGTRQILTYRFSMFKSVLAVEHSIGFESKQNYHAFTSLRDIFCVETKYNKWFQKIRQIINVEIQRNCSNQIQAFVKSQKSMLSLIDTGLRSGLRKKTFRNWNKSLFNAPFVQISHDQEAFSNSIRKLSAAAYVRILTP